MECHFNDLLIGDIFFFTKGTKAFELSSQFRIEDPPLICDYKTLFILAAPYIEVTDTKTRANLVAIRSLDSTFFAGGIYFLANKDENPEVFMLSKKETELPQDRNAELLMAKIILKEISSKLKSFEDFLEQNEYE